MRMRLSVLLSCVSFALAVAAAQSTQWHPLSSGVAARLRGISAVDDRVVWASGSGGTVIRTVDGGATWRTLPVPGAEKRDFRDVDAIDDKTAYVLSIGPGEQSRIYKTADGGATWTEQFVNRDPKAFLDAMAFWDARRGIAVSDSVDGQFVVLKTDDGGAKWNRILASAFPAALDNEGFFAASGTNVAVLPPNHVWIGTGAASESRVLRSSDGGRTWAIARAPLASGPSSGIFSIAFSDARHGIVVGGDYKVEGGAVDNAALTSDGGATWTPIAGLSGFRSVVAYLSRDGKRVLAVGPAGSDYSQDGGATWKPIAGPGFHTFAIGPRASVGFGAGEKGAVAKLQ
jgi:photosystem II stability/assembly factor-like uncharacterized protein